jgi:hypothetical protein
MQQAVDSRVIPRHFDAGVRRRTGDAAYAIGRRRIFAAVSSSIAGVAGARWPAMEVLLDFTPDCSSDFRPDIRIAAGG